MALVTFEQAKAHLRVDDEASNVDIEFKLNQASAIILKYCETHEDAASWDDGSIDVPGNIQAAVLCVLTDLREVRAIDWLVVERLCVGYRDPTLA